MKIAPFILCPFLLMGGCASNPGVVPLGKDTYILNRQGKALGATAGSTQIDTLKEANSYCQSIGKVFQVVRMDGHPAAPARFPEASIQFMCLSENDPELSRPKLRKDPDTVVEMRQ